MTKNIIKTNLIEMSPDKIPQVDRSLEEDSFLTIQQNSKTAYGHQQFSQQRGKEELQNNDSIIEPQLTQTLIIGQQIKIMEGRSIGDIQTQQAKVIQELQKRTVREEDIKGYFARQINSIGVFQAFQDRLADLVTLKIKQQIKNGKVIVEQVRKQIRGQQRQKPNEKELKRQLQIKKIDIIQKLKQIQEEETKIMLQMKKIHSPGKQYAKIKLTQEDKQRLNNLIKSKKQFEDSLARKNEELLQLAKLKKQQQNKKREYMFELQNQKKKIKIIKSLKQLQSKAQQREQLLKNSAVRRNRKYIHQINEDKYKLALEQKSNSIKTVLSQLQKDHAINFASINEHDKRYSIDLEKRKHINKSKKLTSSTSLPRREKTRFDQIVEQELFQTKENNYKKVMKFKEHEFKEKISKYRDLIDQSYKPKIDPSKSFSIPVLKTYSSISLTKAERIEKGLTYLAQSKKLRRSVSNSEKKVQQVKLPSGYSVYKDYLKDREYSNQNNNKKELNDIMHKPKINLGYEQIQKAKYLVDGLSAKFKLNGDRKMYHSMKTKLMLLDSLY